MTNKFEKLTPQQELDLVEWRKKYFAIGWCTAPSDRPAAETAVAALYERLGKKCPPFVWFDSPIAAAKCIKESGGGNVTLSGDDGCIDAYLTALYTFGRHIGVAYKPEDAKYIDHWDTLVASTGPCYPYTKVCLMTERPCIATYDERERLHGEGAPAIEYRDGNKIFAVHGIRVPEVVVMRPWELTLEQIEAQTNEDIRTIMQDAWCHLAVDSTGRHLGVGGGRWLEETGAQHVDMDVYTAYTDEETGEPIQIQRALLVDKRGWKYLTCSDSSTDHVYHIRAAADVKTCREAHESINGGIPDSKISVSA